MSVGSKLGWFIAGVVSGIVLLESIKRMHDESESEDVEALAESISNRLELLEKEMEASPN